MVKEIKLTKGKVAIVDDDTFEKYGKYKWHCVGGRYAARSVGGAKNKRMVYLHRLIADAPSDKVVDHINGDPMDNRRSNLRVCTQSGNVKNQRVRNDNTSGYKGVSYAKQVSNKRPWEAKINKDGKTYHIDYFDNPHDAARMYNFWAVDMFGEFANLNTVKES